MHASDIAQHIDWIPENRRDFTARDILNEVNDKINWMKNVHIDFYGKDECDVFSVVFEWFMNNPQEDPIKYFMDHEWHINLQTRQIHIEDRKEPPVRNEHGFYYDADIFNDYSDYKGWVNLSKFIKGTHTYCHC